MAQKNGFQVKLGTKEIAEGKKYLAELKSMEAKINQMITDYRSKMKVAAKLQDTLSKDSFQMAKLADQAQAAGASPAVVNSIMADAEAQSKLVFELQNYTNKTLAGF